MTTIINIGGQKRSAGCITQVIWWLFIGWWLSLLAVTIAWFLMATVIGIPLGIAIINAMPKIVALREPEQAGIQIIQAGGVTVVNTQGTQQLPFVLRALWFLFVGLWVSAFWMALAWLACITVLGLPIGFWMFDKTPGILTLKR
jgi:uncharacterized membrane protein YccF (DUF307 family)